MISSFFDKTKPINFLVLLGFAMLLFWAVTFKFHGIDLQYQQIFERILASIALVISVFLMGNMVKTKKLTLDNSFTMLFFVLLLLVFFSSLKRTESIFCCLFLLISWERSLSLKLEKNHKEKVFESALWILVASLFLDWALLFLIPLYVAISLFCGKQLRLWLMPIASIACMIILCFASTLFLDTVDFFSSHYRFSVSLDFFLKPKYGVALYIIFIFILVFIVFGKLGYRRLGRTLSLRLIFVFLVASTILMMFSSMEENGIVILSFFPAAVFLANYVETIKKQRIKEMVVLFCVFLTLTSFVIRLVQ